MESVIVFTAVITGIYLFYRWLLPKPLPGIPYNPEATKSLFGDAPAMSREISVTGEFSMWLANQVEKMRSPVCQVFIRPFSKPWILVADFQESQDILMRRTEFDKPQFLIDGMQALGDFNARYKTNSAFRARRHLKQDLMTPRFLNNIMGPYMHAESLKLLQLLESKMNLAGGRPFAIKSDYYHAALDIMTYYAFGENITDSAIDPQLQIISVTEPTKSNDTQVDEPVQLPEAPVSAFLVAVQDAPEVLEKTTISWAPKLSFWYWKHQSWYKKIFSQKDLVVPMQLQRAIDNYQSGEVRTALEHILMREETTAKKEGRKPRFESQSLVDEVMETTITS